MIHRIRAVLPVPGFEEILASGDPGARTRVIRQRDGIRIEDDVWQWIMDLVESLGLDDLKALLKGG